VAKLPRLGPQRGREAVRSSRRPAILGATPDAEAVMQIRRSRRALEAFLGACFIYAVMAACNGGGNGNSSHTAGGGGAASGGHGHGGGAMSGPGGSDGSGIFDALMDPVPEADANPMSGSRLKKHYLDGSDGSREDLPGWYDSQRMEDCAFTRAGDGKQRCLPTNAANWPGWYGDNQCTIPVIMVSLPPLQCNFTPPVLARNDSVDDVCAGTAKTRVYSVGGQAPIGSGGYVTLCSKASDGSCTQCGTAQYNNVAFYHVGAEIDPSSFVAATEKTDP
jgi:hypothetical protein